MSVSGSLVAVSWRCWHRRNDDCNAWASRCESLTLKGIFLLFVLRLVVFILLMLFLMRSFLGRCCRRAIALDSLFVSGSESSLGT